MLLTIYDTEWPILCQETTHSLVPPPPRCHYPGLSDRQPDASCGSVYTHKPFCQQLVSKDKQSCEKVNIFGTDLFMVTGIGGGFNSILFVFTG